MQYPINMIMEEVKFFYKNYTQQSQSYFLPKDASSRRSRSKMKPEDVIVIIILYHLSGYKNFRILYEECLEIYLKKHFKELVSYSWFIRLRLRYMHVMYSYLTKCPTLIVQA